MQLAPMRFDELLKGLVIAGTGQAERGRQGNIVHPRIMSG